MKSNRWNEVSAGGVVPSFTETNTVLAVDGVSVAFPAPDGVDGRVVRDVSLSVNRGQVLALVGESGSGKTQLALALLGMTSAPGTVVAGHAMFGGKDILSMGAEELRRMRGAGIAMIFQDPLTALNPLVPIGTQITDVVRSHSSLSRKDARVLAIEKLKEVGIADASQRLGDYPHQFSGGQRQRILIAIALALAPEVILADEPTTALDVTVQAEVLDRLTSLGREHDMGIVLVTHDLGLVAEYADQIAVMYTGRIVEYGSAIDVFDRPGHPYTRALMTASPGIRTRRGAVLETIEGRPPSVAEMPAGCSFEPRCALSAGRQSCKNERPALTVVGASHMAACHFSDEVDPTVEEEW